MTDSDSSQRSGSFSVFLMAACAVLSVLVILLAVQNLRLKRELSEQIAGGWQIQEIAQPDEERVVLTLYGRDADGESRRRHLLLCGSAESGRISLVERLPRKPAAPPGFAQWLKAHVVGARVRSLRILGRDRIVGIDL